MKNSLGGLMLVLAVLFGGCGTRSLTVEEHGPKFAPRLGLEKSDIQFLSYGDFIAQIEYKDLKVVTQKGIMALTDSDLKLVARHNKYLFSKELSSFPYHEMEGVSKIAAQIHILFRGDTIVLEFNPLSNSYVNSEEAETAFQLLAQAGVPAYEVTETVDIPQYTGRYNSRYRGRSRTENYQRNSYNQPFYQDSFFNQDPDRYFR